MIRILPLLLLMACASGPQLGDFQAKLHQAQAIAAKAEAARDRAESAVYDAGQVIVMVEQAAEEKARQLLAANARIKRAEKQVQALRKMKSKVKRVVVERIRTAYKADETAAPLIAKLKQGLKEARAVNARAAAGAAVLRGVIDGLNEDIQQLEEEKAMGKSVKGRMPMIGVGLLLALTVAVVGRIIFMVAQEA